jgi:predicted component of type VI protein secretion system
MVYSTAERIRQPVEDTSARRPARPALVHDGMHHDLGLRGGTIGRSRECEVVLDDRNVSRRHAEIRVDASGTWTVHDLGSTNGVRVNGRPVGGGGEELRAGDAIELGTAEVVFELE